MRRAILTKVVAALHNLPNILSLLRLALSFALPFATARPALFVALYALCGLSDVLDGFLARRFGWQTKLGATLDSIGDTVFWLAALYVFVFRAGLFFAQYLVVCVGLIVALKAVNLLIARLKFRQWGLLHTLANKAAGLGLFFVLPVCILLGRVPLGLGIFVCALTGYAALEEFLLLLLFKTYDANRKSIFMR